MKDIRIHIVALITLFQFSSCEDYLKVELKDQISFDEVFEKRKTTEEYLAHVYSFIPNEYNPLGAEGSAVPRSDEASFSWLSITYLNYNSGSWGPADSYYVNWSYCYEGINQASIFIDNVHKCLEIPEESRNIMQAEARFIRAYLYFTLFRKYGPVFVWGDKQADKFIDPTSIDRHSLDVNANFMFSEYDKAIKILPLTIESDAWYGRITKGAAMAAKSRLALYLARPLFNGCSLYKGLRNRYGEFLFPQQEDPDKWEVAAKAAKDIIDLNIYSLYEDRKETDNFKKAIKSYMGVIFEKWNSEIIWGRYHSDGITYNVRTAPPRVVREGYGGFCPSIKLVDTYPMAVSGRFPVTGYEANGRPIIDSKSGYIEEGFTSSWIHPIDSDIPIKAHNSCVGRDARFYASILANGMYWINPYKGSKLVTFYTGGTSTYDETQDCVKVGYLWRRMSDPANNIEEDKWGAFCWPMYRLAEVYLNYAEACNEKPDRNEKEALEYINEVRHRSGLNNLEDAYPEVTGNKKLLRELLRKERMIELAFENHRYYDIRTWMISEQEFNGIRYARNLLATNYEDSWQRTDQIFKDKMVFEPKHYLFPIHQDQLEEMVNMTQNYGW